MCVVLGEEKIYALKRKGKKKINILEVDGDFVFRFFAFLNRSIRDLWFCL